MFKEKAFLNTTIQDYLNKKNKSCPKLMLAYNKVYQH